MNPEMLPETRAARRVRLFFEERGKQESLVEGKREGLVEGKREGLVEGLVEGKRESLLRLLTARELDVCPEDREMIAACVDASQLNTSDRPRSHGSVGQVRASRFLTHQPRLPTWFTPARRVLCPRAVPLFVCPESPLPPLGHRCASPLCLRPKHLPRSQHHRLYLGPSDSARSLVPCIIPRWTGHPGGSARAPFLPLGQRHEGPRIRRLARCSSRSMAAGRPAMASMSAPKPGRGSISSTV